ncbi:MAG: alpha-glucan family phosphorylase [Gemmatimonadota bacterium]|nr:alpha-glucan family phosphorylase [Gemmatimonadota bacterium]
MRKKDGTSGAVGPRTAGGKAPAADGPVLPPRLERLAEFGSNLAWTWDRDARDVFRRLDLNLWRRTHHNPIDLLRLVEPSRITRLAEDPAFLERYDAVCRRADRDSEHHGTWWESEFPGLGRRPIAYFCAEFGLHESVPIYSGGLGVLAGDHCKAASDLGVPLVGVGLLYARGYFDQRVDTEGWQHDGDATFETSRTPLERLFTPDGSPVLTRVYGSNRKIHIGAWRLNVGRVSLILLDSDLEENAPEDRELTHKLYAGGVSHRLRQEGLLGIGGVRVLEALGIEPAAWHANEGHAAFMMVERARRLIAAGATMDEATAAVRATSVFTTHTPVAAGHDVFTHEQLEEWAGDNWDRIETRDELLALGRHPTEEGDRFHMTAAAIRLSGKVNGVSERHGSVTREIWKSMWPERDVAEVPIGHVTNGVHLATWMHNDIMDLLDHHLGPDWGLRIDEDGLWDGIDRIPDEELWRVHQSLKIGLIDFMREDARRRWRDEWSEAAHLVGAGTLLSPFPLTIGFARRFATYKRADLLFRDSDRLLALLSNPRRPVQLVFAGKAHPRDDEGKRVLQGVYAHTRDPRFEGRIAFLEDYGLHIAHRLVEGVDLWLNLPRVPLEASGTSGMKAALNGVPMLSTRDGWWEEGYAGENGWSIPRAPEKMDQKEADAHDAEHAFRLLEEEIVPRFYDRPIEGPPAAWIQTMRKAIAIAAPRFTARRMVQDYVRDYYAPAVAASSEAAAGTSSST